MLCGYCLRASHSTPHNLIATGTELAWAQHDVNGQYIICTWCLHLGIHFNFFPSPLRTLLFLFFPPCCSPFLPFTIVTITRTQHTLDCDAVGTEEGGSYVYSFSCRTYTPTEGALKGCVLSCRTHTLLWFLANALCYGISPNSAP